MHTQLVDILRHDYGGKLVMFGSLENVGKQTSTRVKQLILKMVRIPGIGVQILQIHYFQWI